MITRTSENPSGVVAHIIVDSGSISVDNFPATQDVNVTGIVEVEVKNDVGNPLIVSISNVPTVNIGTIPEIEIKNDSGNPIPVTGTVAISGTIPISGSVTVSNMIPAVETGLAKDATVIITNTEIGIVTEVAPATDTASSGLNGRLQRIAQRITSLISLLPISLGQKTMANSFAVTIASDQSSIPVAITSTTSSTATTSNATITNSSSTALAANTSRKMVTIYNDAGRNVYIRFGGTASTTSFTIRMSDNSYYELPNPIYTGAIHAITNAGSGDIRITEFT